MAKSSAPSTNKLTATVRARTGKGASRQARRDGKVPAVLYGHGTEPQHLEIEARAFATVLRHAGTNAVLNLQIDGAEQLALTRALEIHPIRRSIQHADLLVVKRGEKVIVEVNVIVEGEAAPGTLVTQDGNYVEIEAEALSIPEQIMVSVEGFEAGTQILASQLDLGEATLVSDPEALIVNIVVAPTAAEMEAESGGASLEEQAEADEETAAEAPAEAE